MREIKYRVWSKQASRYIGGMLLGQTGSLYAMRFDAKPDEEENEDYVIELYTGLNDKNGKEIYGGDIVTEHNGDIIGEVDRRPDGSWSIRWIGVYGGRSVLYDENHLCEIIGNIHKNPELLETENERD